MDVPTNSTHAAPGRLRTVGDIARDLRVPYYRIRYALRTSFIIKPTCQIGNCLCFNDAQVALIRQRLAEIADKQRKAA